MIIVNTRAPYKVIARIRDYRTELKGVNLRQAQLSDANLEGADLSGCDLGATWFNRSRLCSSDFSGSLIRLGRFCDADLRGANFSQSVMKGVDFSGCNLEAATFEGANLVSVVFTNANLSNANFKNASVRPSSLVGARLDHVDFSGASIDFSISGIRGSGTNQFIRFAHIDRASIAYTSDKVRIGLLSPSVSVSASISKLHSYNAVYSVDSSMGQRAFAWWWQNNGQHVLDYIAKHPALPTEARLDVDHIASRAQTTLRPSPA